MGFADDKFSVHFAYKKNEALTKILGLCIVLEGFDIDWSPAY